MNRRMSHALDLTSLIWGMLLLITAGLLAVEQWTSVDLDAARVVPVGLVGLGLLILGATFLRGSSAG